MGTYPKTEAFSRVFGGAEADAETLSAVPTHTLDPGQFLSAQDVRGEAVVSEEQRAPGVDADERFMAESDRVSFHSGEGVCDLQLGLHRAFGNRPGTEPLRGVSQPPCGQKAKEPFLKRH